MLAHGNAHDLLKGSDTEQSFSKRRFTKGKHSFLDSLPTDVIGRSAVQNDFAETLGHGHDLVNADTALVA